MGASNPNELDPSQDVRTKEQRRQAIGEPVGDQFIDTLHEQAEQLFLPKRIHDKGDWLMNHKENGQPMSKYTRQSNVIKWTTKDYNVLVLYILDNQVPKHLVDAIKRYCDAFFVGCRVVVKHGGDPVQAGSMQKFPKNFFDHHNIKFRDDDKTSPDRQAYTGDILNHLVKYKVKGETYAVLGVTMVDLYPGVNWSWCFGWANFGSGSGVFSFCRYPPSYKDNRLVYGDYDYVPLACHTMAHEICHMFGMHHCVFYECLMNGYNSLDEQMERKNNTLCPVCITKLHQNIGFDVRARYQALLKVATQLKIPAEVEQYKRLLSLELTAPKIVKQTKLLPPPQPQTRLQVPNAQ